MHVPIKEAQPFSTWLAETYPWSQRDLTMGKPLEWIWTIDVDVSPDALWEPLVDTSRFNRALGLSEMKLTEKNGVLHGESKIGGLLHRWIEEPWGWVYPKHLLCVRRYEKGYEHLARIIYRLDAKSPNETGTRLWVYFGIIPRNILAAQICKLGMKAMEQGYRRVVPLLAKKATSAKTLLQKPPEKISEESSARLKEIKDQLLQKKLSAPAIDALLNWIVQTDDFDATRLQVKVLARQAQLPVDEILQVCLYGTRLGLLEMSWDVICPHCRGVRNKYSLLSELESSGRCEVCEIEFPTDEERSLEITFHIHPSIRKVPERLYCSAEANSKRHIYLQRTLAAGETRSDLLDLKTGTYILRQKGEKEFRKMQVKGDLKDSNLYWKSTRELPKEIRVSPLTRVTLQNAQSQAKTYVIEQETWSQDSLLPGELLSFQDFRDLFTEEYLAAEVRIAVGEQTVLFTDIVGSTRFYRESGDPRAFFAVKAHFIELNEIVRRNRGAIVKTIGDAVMAAFAQPINALRASREIHDCFHAKRADTPIRLRISLNTGPCIAVRLSSNIDYFGGTVNLAAKAQALAEEGQIAFTETTLSAPGVQAYLQEQSVALESLTLEGKFSDQPIPIFRWTTKRV